MFRIWVLLDTRISLNLCSTLVCRSLCFFWGKEGSVVGVYRNYRHPHLTRSSTPRSGASSGNGEAAALSSTDILLHFGV